MDTRLLMTMIRARLRRWAQSTVCHAGLYGIILRNRFQTSWNDYEFVIAHNYEFVSAYDDEHRARSVMPACTASFYGTDSRQAGM